MNPVKVSTREELIDAVMARAELIHVTGDLASKIDGIKDVSDSRWAIGITSVIGMVAAGIALAIPEPGEAFEAVAFGVAWSGATLVLGELVAIIVSFVKESNGKEALEKIRKDYNSKKISKELLVLTLKNAQQNMASTNTKNIVFLGSSGAGKTTCWKILRHEPYTLKDANTGKDIVESFEMKRNQDIIHIRRTKDIGGDHSWVPYYSEVICENSTVVYFLIDMRFLNEEMKQEVRSRLRKIDTVFKEKNLKNCKIQLAGTHLREFDKNQGEPRSVLTTWLDSGSIPEISPGVIRDKVYAWELQNDSDQVQLYNSLF